jgi:hypothetical protein
VLLQEGPRAWQKMGGTPALADLGVVDSASLSASLEQISQHSQGQYAYRIWDVLNLEAWLRPRL